MDAVKTLARLTRVEALKFWQKSTARVVLALLFLGPIAGELILWQISEPDAVFPNVTHLLFAPDTVIFVALATVVVSVLALGNDYELGTVRVILSRGATRSQFVLSKIATTVGAALVYGLTYMAGALLATVVVHITQSDVPLVDAAGGDILWRAVGTAIVIGLVGFVSSGIVMLALVLGRSAWVGMLAGLGYFLADFLIGGLGLVDTGGLGDVYRYSMTYYAFSILQRTFPQDPNLGLPRAWAQEGLTGAGEAAFALLLYGVVLTLAAILIFRRQDVVEKA